VEVVGGMHPRAVIGEDEYSGVSTGLFHQPAHLLVGKLVLLQKSMAIGLCPLHGVRWIGWIHVFTEEVIGHVRVGEHHRQQSLLAFPQQVHTLVRQLLDHVGGGANTPEVRLTEELRGEIDVGEPRHLLHLPLR
jgi:hypothetical protein